MKNIIFTVRPEEKTSIIDVINGLKSYSGRCRIDFAANKIDVDIEEDEKIDEIIDFINQNYTILRIDMAKSQKVEETETTQGVGFTSDEEVVINGMHYNSSELQHSLDKLFKVMNLAMSSKKYISTDEICYYLDTCKQEMSMKFNPMPRVKNLNVGDVVTVNYGMHLDGELNGWVAAVVCDIKDKMICLIPILKDMESPDKFETKKCTFFNKFVAHGAIMLNLTNYVRIERIVGVNGKVSEEYLKELKEKLAKAFDFSNN